MHSIPISLLIQILEQYFVRRSGKRPMTGKLFGLDAEFKTSTNSKWEIFEDHSFPGLEHYEIPVLQPSGYRSFPPGVVRGLGIISYGLWLVDIEGTYGGFVCCYSPTSMNKSANIKWNEITDRMEIMPYGGNCAFVAYDNQGWPPGPQPHDVAMIVGNVANPSFDLIGKAVVRVSGSVGNYYVRKTDDTLVPIFNYNESLNMITIGLPSYPGQAIASPFDIPFAGDISLLDDKFLKVAKDSDATLPTPSATYRGKMIRVEGGAGVADHLYMCMKGSDDTYSWAEIA